MNWGLLEDKQKFKISIPIGKMSVGETEMLIKELKKMSFDTRIIERQFKLDKIMGIINEKEL